jgi:hypothetical protein
MAGASNCSRTSIQYRFIEICVVYFLHNDDVHNSDTINLNDLMIDDDDDRDGKDAKRNGCCLI